MEFIASFKYAILTIKHKWFVFCAGLKTGTHVSDLLLHDLSKFGLKELPHYGKQFLGKKDDPLGFINCWIHHQNRNKHHWEFWIPRTGYNRCTPPYPDDEPVPMPERYVREMIADWLGASRAYEGKWPTCDNWPWLKKNFNNIRVHPETRALLMKILVEELGFVIT